jgi:hypothetical protein
LFDDGKAVLDGELLGPSAHQQCMAAVFQHLPCEKNRIGNRRHGPDSATQQQASVHDRSVELDGAARRETGSHTGVENRVVFQGRDGAGNGFKGTPSVGENLPSGIASATTPRFLLGSEAFRVRAGAAVNDDRWALHSSRSVGGPVESQAGRLVKTEQHSLQQTRALGRGEFVRDSSTQQRAISLVSRPRKPIEGHGW